MPEEKKKKAIFAVSFRVLQPCVSGMRPVKLLCG